MSHYTYANSATAAGSVDPAQLEIEINNSLSVPCSRIDTLGDNFTVYFGSILSDTDQTALGGVISAHTPVAAPTVIIPYVKSGSSLLTADVGNVEFTYLGSQSVEIHISKESQGHFSSLRAAMDAHPYADRIFIVHPGIYVENNPMVMQPGCVIVAHGNAENTIIAAANPNSNIIHMNVKCKLEGINFTGATGASGVVFNCSQSGGQGRYSAIMECFVTNCNIAVDVNGGGMVTLGGIPDTLYARELIVSSTNSVLDKGIYVHNEGQFIGSAISVFGVPPTPAPTPAYPITYGYYCTGRYSKMAMAVANCYFCVYAAYWDDNCSTEISLMTLKFNYIGAAVGPTGTTTRFSVNSLDIGGSSYKDLIIQSTEAQVEIHSGVFDDTKIFNPNSVRLNMRYHTIKGGQTRQHMLGIINVGSINEPAKMFIGEGSYDIYGCAVLTNTDGEVGTFANITADAAEESGTDFNLFGAITAGSCLYLGRDSVPLGIKINVKTATTVLVQLSDLAWEYWNGTTWVEFSVMTCDSTEPYTYLEKGFMSEVSSFHIRFGLRSNAPLVAKTLSGLSKKWVRCRLLHAISSMPTSDYVLFHTSCCKINSDGYVEYFGDARQVRKLQWESTAVTTTDDTPGNQAAYLSKSISMSGVYNRFIDGAVGRVGYTTFLPTDLDNSLPIKFKIMFIGSTADAGVITFTLKTGYSNIGEAVYTDSGSAPTSADGEIVHTVDTGVSAANIQTMCELTLDTANINMNPTGLGPEMFWVTLERNGITDTYVGDVIVLQFVAYYISWTSGAHILNY